MDWRNRKYYYVTFDPQSRDMRLRYLRLIEGLKIHQDKKYIAENRHYHFLISVHAADAEVVEYELRKAERNDEYCIWRKACK